VVTVVVVMMMVTTVVVVVTRLSHGRNADCKCRNGGRDQSSMTHHLDKVEHSPLLAMVGRGPG
jgi:hypothetical protein